MKLFQKIKDFINTLMLKSIVKKFYADEHGNFSAKKFADAVNETDRKYVQMKLINLNKYLTRSVQGVLYLFNYDRYNLPYIKYEKDIATESGKIKFTSYLSSLDYEDYKKIIYYDDLYEIYIKDYTQWHYPDDIDTDKECMDFVKKIESYPSIRLKQIKEKFPN